MSNNRHNIPYGFFVHGCGNVHVHAEESEAVKKIFDLYLDGCSLGKIADELAKEEIVSPSGNDTWTRDAINRILRNEKYVPYIIDSEYFAIVQAEKRTAQTVTCGRPCCIGPRIF